MIEKLKEVEQEFIAKIHENEQTQKLNSYKKAFDICKEYLDKLKFQVSMSSFLNDQDEISYFKEIKPNVNSLVIYYKSIIDIESQIPLGSIEIKKSFLEGRFRKLLHFHDEYSELISYFRSQNTNLDKQYFLRTLAQKNHNFDLLFPEIDKVQSTGYDIIIATFIAYEKIEYFLQNRIRQLEHSPVESKQEFQFRWTDSKTDLVELIYALLEKGSVNNGNVEIKTLIAFFSQNFNISLDEFYRIYYDIKSRKNNKTKFIDGLSDALHLKMERENDYNQ